MGKSGDFGFGPRCIRIGGADSLDTLQAIQGMTVVVDSHHPLEFLFNGFAARQHALLNVGVAQLQGGKHIGLAPDTGQIAVLEGDAIGPIIGLASGKETFIRVQTIGEDEDWQAWVQRFELGGHTGEGLALAVLFVVLATFRVFDPHCRD